MEDMNMTRHHVTASGLEVVQSRDGFNVIGNNPPMTWLIWRQSGGKWQCGRMTNATLAEVMAHIEQQYADSRASRQQIAEIQERVNQEQQQKMDEEWQEFTEWAAEAQDKAEG